MADTFDSAVNRGTSSRVVYIVQPLQWTLGSRQVLAKYEAYVAESDLLFHQKGLNNLGDKKQKKYHIQQSDVLIGMLAIVYQVIMCKLTCLAVRFLDGKINSSMPVECGPEYEVKASSKKFIGDLFYQCFLVKC